MIQKSSIEKILQEFFDFPTKKFQMREISRRVKLAQPSVIKYLKLLIKENLVLKEKGNIYPAFRANRENELFKLYKKIDTIKRINESGLLENLYESTLPGVIILFGSSSKGEDIEESDIDIFVLSKEKKISLEKYEKILNRKISLFFENDFLRLNKELKNNILNGIILKGYFGVF
jgi:predicted nucleotidyltransferase